MTLTLGLPSKGRLQSDTIAWFAHRGIHITRSDDQRQYAAEAGFQLFVLNADGEIIEKKQP